MLYMIPIGLYSIHTKDLHRSQVKITGTIHWFFKE